jgi:hypothetical protein
MFDIENHKIYRSIYIDLISKKLNQNKELDIDLFFNTLIDIHLDEMNIKRIFDTFLMCEMDVCIYFT